MSRTSTPGPSRVTRLHIAARVAAAVLGGYAFAWGVVAAVTSLSFAIGMEFHDAEFLGAVVGLLAYLTVFLWAFAARRLAVGLAAAGRWWCTAGGHGFARAIVPILTAAEAGR